MSMTLPEMPTVRPSACDCWLPSARSDVAMRYADPGGVSDPHDTVMDTMSPWIVISENR